MIYSIELEKRLLAGLIRHPNVYGEIANFINEADFGSDQNKITRTIFSSLKSFCENGQSIDHVILSEKIKSLGISFPQSIEIGDFVYSLSLQNVTQNQVLEVAKELKKYTVRREIFEAAKDVATKVKAMNPDSSYSEIVETADECFNRKIDLFDSATNSFDNIFEEMEDYIEDLGNNPQEEQGFMCPWPIVNDLYGSLFRAGNITVIISRSGVGKTLMALDLCTQVSERYDVPVLHFDNGEMSKNEIMIRQCSALSGVPSHLLETGQWRKAGKEVVEKVRAVWPKIKNLKFYYYSVGGYSSDKMVALVKRFYFSKVGRGNKMIFSFDYIKPNDETGKQEWQSLGTMVDKFKRCIQEEIVFNKEPMVSMFTSAQSNRYGITTNRQSSDVRDDESITGGSDRIIHYCTHAFILRNKTLDELANENQTFGTHVLINVKRRHLGKSYERALAPIKMPDGSIVSNRIHLKQEGFKFECMGDQVDLARRLELQANLPQGANVDDVPDELV
jgi:replicative DNA helicase